MLGYFEAKAKQPRFSTRYVMPFTPKDIPFMGPDIAELVAVGLVLFIWLAVMVLLGRWWAQ